MQTFLPHSCFKQTSKVLDRMRLGKQRVESKQLLTALLTGPVVVVNGVAKKTPWYNHPATKMWKGYESALCEYSIQICLEWRSRGYKDSLLPFFEERLSPNTTYPSWLGGEEFHLSHRSNLLRKLPSHYGQFWSVDPGLPYIWPTTE